MSDQNVSSNGIIDINEKDGLTRLIKASIKILMEAKWRLLKLFLLCLGLSILIVGIMVMIGFASGSWIVIPVLMVLGWLAVILIGLAYYGALQKQAYLTYSGAPVEKIMDSFRQAFNLTPRAIMLSIKTFIYTGAWAILLVMIGFVGMAMLFGSGKMGGLGSLYVIFNFVLGLLGFAVIIMTIIRSVRASMALPYLYATPGLSAQQALDDSIKATKGKWWLIVIYSLAFSILLSLVSGVLNVLLALLGKSILAILMLVILAIVPVAIAMLEMIFKQLLAQELKFRGEDYHL